MRIFPAVVVVVLLCSFGFAQTASRDQKLQQIIDLNAQIKTLEDEVLLPSAAAVKQARVEGFEIFRLMPREKYDNKLTVQGGGSYYSFSTRSHDYQKTAQIGLEQNYLKVGFAGADFGFIVDLADTNLADVTTDTAEVNFLLGYKPPAAEREVRKEAMKAYNYEANGFTYKSRIPALVGHVYILRAISFDRADVLVALRLYRKDTDGSLIIFWKMLENFEKPSFERDRTDWN
jgi:hypothetical protein